MGLVSRTNYAAGGTITAAGQNSNENAIVNEFNGNIENVNIKSSAAIASSKLDLSAIASTMAMSSAIFKQAKGADVASVAGAITLGDDGNYFDITGTNAITSITAKTAGTVVILQFDSTATLTDGSNLKLASNFTGAAEAQIMLVCDGTNWFEVCRNNGAFTPSTSNALSGSVIQTVNTMLTVPVDVIADTVIDDTAPLYSEGTLIGSLAITPTNASNKLFLRASFWGSISASAAFVFWINDATGSDEALAVRQDNGGVAAGAESCSIELYVTAGGTSQITFYLMGAADSGSTFYVGRSSAGADLYGAAAFGSITIQEIKA